MAKQTSIFTTNRTLKIDAEMLPMLRPSDETSIQARVDTQRISSSCVVCDAAKGKRTLMNSNSQTNFNFND